MRKSIAQGLMSQLILGFEAIMLQLFDNFFLLEVSHNWYHQAEENMAQLIAYASKEVGDIKYYHEAINQPDAIEFAIAIIKE